MNKFFAVLVGLSFVFVPGVLWAQTNLVQTPTLDSDSVDTVATTTVPVAADQWYETENIFGDVNVGDFVVGPGRTEVRIEPGQTVVRELSITNRISEERIFTLQVEDIAGTDDGSQAMRVVEGERGPYSIRDYISFPQDSIKLNLGERARVPVTISVPPDAQPGGYYGSILVSTVRVGESGDAIAPRNPIIARVGSHVFLTVPGDITQSGQTLGLSTLPSMWWYESGPMNFGLSYENTGTVHVNPYGELSVTNLFGQEIGRVELDPWFVLPQSIRTREIIWDRGFLFGRYTAHATVNRGYDDILDEVHVSFWVLPWKLLTLLFGTIFIVVFACRVFLRSFEFRRRL